MICFWAWNRALKVWKNSSCVESRPELGQEVNVVDDEHVDIAETVAELAHLAALHAIEKLRRKSLARRVIQACARVGFDDLEAHRLQEVRFAQPDAPVHEERVVRAPGVGGDRLSRGVGQLISRAHDKVRKVVIGVDDQRLVGRGRGGLGGRRGPAGT